MLTAGIFIAAFVTGCLLALFRHPIFGLITYVAVFYLHPPARWWGDFFPFSRWSFLAAFVTLIGLLIRSSDTNGPRLFQYSLIPGSLVFLAWLALQTLWALNRPMHIELLALTAKYLLLIMLIYRCIDSRKHLRYFLWAHSAGCFYLGMIVFSSYIGGRFEGFGGPGISEANAGSLQIVTGVIVTFALFLSGKWIEKGIAVTFMPFILNALVATISRSGFLALTVAGMLFNMFAPLRHKKVVRVLSVIGLVLFISLTNPVYWDRIDTLLNAGEKIEGEDTGFGRVVLMQAQLGMFAQYPFGCGHRCTAALSSQYLPDQFLTGSGENRGRSSHNTFFSLLVEHGIPGIVFYCLLIVWMSRMVFKLKEPMRRQPGLLANSYTATVAVLGAIFVGDMFVDYLKYEARVWFLAILMVLYKLQSTLESAQGSNNLGSAFVDDKNSVREHRPDVPVPPSNVRRISAGRKIQNRDTIK